MKSLFLIVFAGLSVLVLSSCASKEQDPTRADREQLSTVPWNTPQSWEGKGSLGGLVQ